MKGKRTKKIHKKGLLVPGVEEVEQLVCEDQAFRLAFCSINATPRPGLSQQMNIQSKNP